MIGRWQINYKCDRHGEENCVPSRYHRIITAQTEMQGANLKNKRRGLAEAAAKVCLFMACLALVILHNLTHDLFS